MSAQPLPSTHTDRRRGLPTAWLDARSLWGGLGVISMWLAVLFVGIFGGDITSSSAGGSSSSVPVVVVVAGVALIGTVVIGRRAFGPAPDSADLRTAIEDERRKRERLAAEVSDLRATLTR